LIKHLSDKLEESLLRFG